jgi:transposase
MPARKSTASKLTDEQVAKLTELYNASPRISYQEIAHRLKVTHGSLRYTITNLQKAGVLLPRNGFGSLDPTEQQIERLKEICNLRLTEQKSWHEIGQHFGLTRQAVHAFASKHLPELFDERKRVNPPWYKDLEKLYNSGMTRQVELQKMFGKSSKGIRDAITTLFEQGRIKYTPPRHILEKVEKIHRLRQEGKKWTQVAEALGTSYPSLYRLYTKHKHRITN